MRVAGLVCSAVLICGAATVAHAGDNFVKPTDEELKMTAQPGYPGVPAVVLFREVITDDDNHSEVHYERIKVLSEKGKEYANVELRFYSGKSSGGEEGDDKSITGIQGRTIHPDGKIIPFTGKPYQKTIVNSSNFRYQARVFTLPDVEVGSILEYRYVTRIADNFFEPPQWILQSEDLYAQKVHYKWLPTAKYIGGIVYFDVLPAAIELKRTARSGGQGSVFELSGKDIPPSLHDDYMPPIQSLSFRVLFAYSGYHSDTEFWKGTGSDWSKGVNSFVGPDGNLKSETEKIVAGAATSDEKLRKIYAVVMSLENTDYTRNRERNEDKAEGLGKISRSSDVLTHKRGTSTQLTDLFVGMARAAGFKAYVALVPDRSKTLFAPGWLSFEQFDDVVAIVNVDGTEKYFDPGSRYCDYGSLEWTHTYASGIRQVEGGTTFAQLPGELYSANKTLRIADLKLEANGEVHGTVTLTFIGAPALHWRHQALTGDDESLRRGLREELEALVPKGLEVKVASVTGADLYDKPMVVKYDVKGALGTATGKRLLLPPDIFVVGEAPAFPHEKRDVPVYFHYPESVLDAMRITIPPTLALEVPPTPFKTQFQKSATFGLSADVLPTSITMRRTLASNTILVPLADYPALRTFYADVEAKDHEPIVLKTVASSAAPAGN